MKSLQEEKVRLRRHALALMKSIGAKERKAKAESIQRHVIDHGLFGRSQVIMLYASIQYEVPTEKIIEEAIVKGKKVVLPRIDKVKRQIVPYGIENPQSDLERGVYGILEPRLNRCQPCPINSIEWILVPGLLFDRSHYRLGRGLGYYDHFLSQLNRKTQTAGLAFDFQITDSLPHDDHDIPLDDVISNLS